MDRMLCAKPYSQRSVQRDGTIAMEMPVPVSTLEGHQAEWRTVLSADRVVWAELLYWHSVQRDRTIATKMPARPKVEGVFSAVKAVWLELLY